MILKLSVVTLSLPTSAKYSLGSLSPWMIVVLLLRLKHPKSVPINR